MKLPLNLAWATAVLCLSAPSADWDSMRRNPVRVEVLEMKPQPLVEAAGTAKWNGWLQVPPKLKEYGAIVYMPTKDHLGVAEIKVVADGYLLLACNYDYQGNSGGDWAEERWDEERFVSRGWHPLSKAELGGDLVKTDKRQQVVFGKAVRKGETLRLRCNKYDPPYPIVIPEVGGKLTAPLKLEEEK
jgi:hypothetical protein